MHRHGEFVVSLGMEEGGGRTGVEDGGCRGFSAKKLNLVGELGVGVGEGR